jgi:hypothetical protein
MEENVSFLFEEIPLTLYMFNTFSSGLSDLLVNSGRNSGINKGMQIDRSNLISTKQLNFEYLIQFFD